MATYYRVNLKDKKGNTIYPNIHNLISISSTGGLTLSQGGILISQGNIRLQKGNLTLDTGNITLNTGGITLSTAGISLPESQYAYNGVFGIDCNNSDIIGVNSIYFQDATDSTREGIHFYHTESAWNTVWVKSGELYFTKNHNWNDAVSTGHRIITTEGFKEHLYLTQPGESILSSGSKIIFGNSSTSYGTLAANKAGQIFFCESVSTNDKGMGYDGSSNAFRPISNNTTASLGTSSYRWGTIYAKSGNFIDNITITEASAGTRRISINNGQYETGLYIGSGGVNHGLYDWTLGKWMVYSDASNTYLNGNATSASTAAKLTTARMINNTSFNGTADILINGRVITTNVTTTTSYWIPFISSVGNADGTVYCAMRANDGFLYRTTEGTTTTRGNAVLILGNTIVTGTAGNKRGMLRLYPESTNYTIDVIANPNCGRAVTATLPHYTSTIVGTPDNNCRILYGMSISSWNSNYSSYPNGTIGFCW